MVERRLVLSLEQAVALPYATLRFRQLGWRVIRIEPTPQGADERPGDPNRYAGRVFADEGRRGFFVPPNVGKEAIALNLKSGRGRELLLRLIAALKADVFCCNILPARHAALGIDYPTLKRAREDLVWASISAMGTEHPDVPGYDPVIQAMSGLMSMNGPHDGPPFMSGVQVTDLKAGDELYANVLLALLERVETGRGKRIDVSMLQAATSWLVTLLPNLDMGDDPAELSRSGNFHRVFVPTGVYAARDGYLYLAIGNTGQWRSLVSLPPFRSLDAGGRWDTLAARAAGRAELVQTLAALIAPLTVSDLAATLTKARIPFSPINTITDVHALAAVRSRMPRTVTPDGSSIRLAPMAVDRPEAPAAYAFAPRYGEHTDAVLGEIGLSGAEITGLRAAGVVA
jgi:crotonobetainyl-CoA:carnitine CoA-transferase CaiB-like acyl-CoA transferase